MWRCAGCGAEVSEWAARCPACRRPTDDATAVTPPAVAPAVAPTVAPAAPTVAPATAVPVAAVPPGPRTAHRRRRVAMSGVVGVAALAAAIGSGLAAPGDPPSPAHAARAFQGRIVSEDQAGRLGIADPDGARAAEYREARGPSGQIAALAVPPDGRFVLDPAGAVLALRGGRPEATPATIGDAALSSQPAEPDPFADHDGAVVVITARAGFLLPQASVVAIATGAASPLGTVDSVAGDPQSLGAFASLPGSDPATQPARLVQVHDTAVALLHAGQPPTVLATAAALDRAASQPPDTPIIPALFPDPAGDRIAVVVDPVSASAASAPVVIIDRRGAVVFAGLPSALANAQVAWSADGRVLAYPTTAHMFLVVTPGPSISTVPVSGAAPLQWDRCVVAPTDTAALCLVEDHSGPRWLYLELTLGLAVAVPSLGTPLAWLAG